MGEGGGFFISEQIMDVKWQNIPRLVGEYFVTSRILCDVVKYSTTSHNNIHFKKEYINFFYNMTWNMF
jgi:hypothetical protein